MSKLNPDLMLSVASMMNRKEVKKPNRPTVGQWVEKTAGSCGVGKVENILNGIALIQLCQINEQNGTINYGEYETIHLDMIDTIPEPKTIAEYHSFATKMWSGKQ